MRRAFLTAWTIAAVAALPHAAAAATVAATPEQTVARSQAVGAAGIAPPLRVAWRHEHASPHHRLLAAGHGRVFVLAFGPGIGPMTLEALSARDGRVLWSREVADAPAASYGSRVLVAVVRREGEIHAVEGIDAATGQTRWRAQPEGSGAMGTPLVVGARAFVPLADRVLALRLSDGRELWSGATPFAKPPAGVAALRGDVLAGGAVEPWRFGQATGAQRYAGNGSVNQSTPAQLGTDGRYVYGRYVDGNRAGVWRASNGAPVTSLPASWQPAVRGGWMYFANGGPGSFDAWSWRNGRPVLRWSVGRSIGWDPALLAGRVVYAKTSMDHCLHALDARTGASLWRSDPLTARGSLPPGAPLTADGRLYLGLDSAVVALRSARGAPSGSCPRTAPARR